MKFMYMLLLVNITLENHVNEVLSTCKSMMYFTHKLFMKQCLANITVVIIVNEVFSTCKS